jgi:hypothetical protein
MRFEVRFLGEADPQHTCHCTNSSAIGMSRAWPVTDEVKGFVGCYLNHRNGHAGFSVRQLRMSNLLWNTSYLLEDLTDRHGFAT